MTAQRGAPVVPKRAPRLAKRALRCHPVWAVLWDGAGGPRRPQRAPLAAFSAAPPAPPVSCRCTPPHCSLASPSTLQSLVIHRIPPPVPGQTTLSGSSTRQIPDFTRQMEPRKMRRKRERRRTEEEDHLHVRPQNRRGHFERIRKATQQFPKTA